MIDQADNTHSPTPATEPLALRLSDGLGGWFLDAKDLGCECLTT